MPLLAQAEATDRWLIRLTPISAEAEEQCAPTGFLKALPLEEGVTPHRIPARLGQAVSTDLQATEEWTLSIDIPGCWAPDTPLEPLDAPAMRDIHLWPTGSVTGRLAVARHEEVPATLRVRVTPAPSETDAERPPTASLTCPVTDQRFTCRLPAERLDLRIAAEGFIPEYRWDVVVSPAETRDLGEIPLVRGASLAGWVAIEETLRVRPRVEVVPETVGGNGTQVGERLSQRTLTVETTERGFFHVRGLAPGSYRLSVEAPGQGTAERAPIVIGERREYVLEEPLVLEPLAEVVASVDPPLGPQLQPWTIRLLREIPISSMYRLEAEQEVDDRGSWQRSGFEPGRYLLQVVDSEGSTHFRRELDVTPGMRPLAIELSLVPVRGTLRAGETPLSRAVWFQRPDGTRIRLDADSQGIFEGVLPDEGRWQVRLEPAQGRGQQRLEKEVMVERAPGEPWVMLDIELSATHLVGEVLDEDHIPIGGALVSVYTPRRTLAQVFTRDDGVFEVHGLPEGAYRARAEAKGNRESDLTSLELAADDGSTSIELIVRDRRGLRGRILLGEQPVAGALVRYQVPQAPLAGSLHASPDGVFTIWLPAWVEEVDLVILAPGLPTKLTRVTVPPTDTRLPPIHLASVSGDLGIRFPDRQALYIRGEGDFVPIWSLLLPTDGGSFRELDETSGLFHLPLEPGSYMICPAPEESRWCEGGYLAPGGRLVLDLRRAATHDAPVGRGV